MKTCMHLHKDSDEYFAWFTGIGVEHHWVCRDCSQQHPVSPTEWKDADSDLVEMLSGMWTCEGVVGTPETMVRASSLTFAHTDVGGLNSQSILDIQPSSTNLWVMLHSSGMVQWIDLKSGSIHREILIEAPFPLDDEVALRVSQRDDYFAVFQASGQFGIVVESSSGKVTARLDRGDYHPEHSFFPLSFIEHGDRTRLIVATQWNRLDVIDPASSEIHTQRENPEYGKGQPRPPHYLDYFHAQLTVSPDQSRVADYGWHWHPLGVIRIWSIPEWLSHNVWESEDGKSLKTVAARDYFWDGPVCWIDSLTLAVWGWGADDEWLVPAVSLFDVTSGELVRWFPGPRCRKAVWPTKKVPPSLFFDEYIFSINEEVGTSVWDFATGERLHVDQHLVPIHYHPVNREFVSRTSNGWRLSRLVK